jgi:6-phosphogluconolactonase
MPPTYHVEIRRAMRSDGRMRAFSLLALLPMSLSAASPDFIVYIGTYTNTTSKGVEAFRLNSATGELKPLGTAAEVQNPSFVAIHPNNQFLYAVSETGTYQGQKTGFVSAYSIDAATGKLTLLNQAATRGSGPCHINVDRSGRMVLISNYSAGSVTAIPIGADGKLGKAGTTIQHHGKSVNPKRQDAPHAHSVNFSADNRFAVVADLGVDRIYVYRFDPATGWLYSNDPPFVAAAPGAGPRHFAFHPKGKLAYAINELASTIAIYDWDAKKGTLTPGATVKTLPADFSGESTTAEVVVHPNGKFVYGSNRGHDSIAIFAVKGKNLELIGHEKTQGRTPRNFAIDPTGKWLIAVNQNGQNLVLFSIDPKTGKLNAKSNIEKVGSPVCVRFVPAK